MFKFEKIIFGVYLFISHCAFEDVLPEKIQAMVLHGAFMHQKQNQYVSPFLIGSKLQIFYS